MIVTQCVCMSCFLKLLWCCQSTAGFLYFFLPFWWACKTKIHVGSTVLVYSRQNLRYQGYVLMYVVLTLKKNKIKKKHIPYIWKKWLWACWYTKPFRSKLVCSCEKEYVQKLFNRKTWIKSTNVLMCLLFPHRCMTMKLSNEIQATQWLPQHELPSFIEHMYW